MIVHYLIESEFAAVKRLHNRIFPLDSWKDVEHSDIHWLFTEEQAPVGFVSGDVKMGGSRLVLQRIGVLKTQSGKKLGVKMLRLVEKFARVKQMREIVTYVLPDNGPSLATFIHAGYLVYNPKHKWAGTGVVYFRKVV